MRRKLIQVIDSVTKRRLDEQQAAMTAQQKAIADQQTVLTSQSTAMSTQEKAIADMAAKPVPIYEDSYAGIVNTPLLALNASQDITLTWDRPFSGTNYVVSILFDVALLGKATFAVKAKTKTTVTITMTASVLLSVQGGLRAYGRFYGLPSGG